MNIVILDALTLGKDVDLNVLGIYGELMIYDTTYPDEVAERIINKDVIITNKVILNESNLKYSENLKLICIAATGTNNIDLSYTSTRNIAVCNVSGYSTNSVAQHTFALLLNLIENINKYDEYVKNGEYSKSKIFTNLDYVNFELEGKTWGIIGMGAIGKKVAQLASTFGCKVIYYSTSGNNTNQGYEQYDLDIVLRLSDIVSIHAPLNVNTLNLINYDKFEIMKKSAILLNVGRGKIVNEIDLARALNENLIKGAALDVFENEPILVENPLLKIKDLSKIVFSPHIAWASYESRVRLVNEICYNIEAFLNDKERNRV